MTTIGWDGHECAVDGTINYARIRRWSVMCRKRRTNRNRGYSFGPIQTTIPPRAILSTIKSGGALRVCRLSTRGGQSEEALNGYTVVVVAINYQAIAVSGERDGCRQWIALCCL